MRRYSVALLFILTCIILLFTCKEKDVDPFRNVKKDAAHYVGMAECRGCHEPIYQTYIQTGMGQSWDIASHAKSAADFSDKHPPVYDAQLNLYYKAFWKGDALFIKEYRLDGRDTTHYREEKISYIVGSGQHTNSHLMDINGYLYQAPITYYTQKGRWDLAPGFEDGHNSRFSRKIELECISCHNGYPNFEEGSLNKYTQVKRGIDCERCHGPGSIHISEKKAGQIVDTSLGPDYSIVNPRRLTTNQQNSLCQRCHLQGIAVLNDNKTFFDFLPSDDLKNTMNVFMPTFSGSQKHMIMASHVERMKMSNCFVNSGKMSCITCHNPHISVKATPQEQFISACKNCHTAQSTCTEKENIRQVKKDNCIKCHMPKNGSIDIPHVAVTDHYIRRRPSLDNEEAIRDFIGLKCFNNDHPDARTKARAFLEFYERYEPNAKLLDSALAYLSLADHRKLDEDIIRTYFLQKNYSELIKLKGEAQENEINDAWTAYRIGESYIKQKKITEGISFLERAVDLKPYGLDYQQKLATAYLLSKQYTKAQKTLSFIMKENPRYESAYTSLGFVYLQLQDFTKSIFYSLEAVKLNPMDEQARINLAVAYYQTRQMGHTKNILLRATKDFPTNEQLKLMLSDLK